MCSPHLSGGCSSENISSNHIFINALLKTFPPKKMVLPSKISNCFSLKVRSLIPLQIKTCSYLLNSCQLCKKILICPFCYK